MIYIIIGFIILFILCPAIVAIGTSINLQDFLYEWWEAFKEMWYAIILFGVISAGIALMIIGITMVVTNLNISDFSSLTLSFNASLNNGFSKVSLIASNNPLLIIEEAKTLFLANNDNILYPFS